MGGLYKVPMIRLIKGDARSSDYRLYDHSRVFVTVVRGTKISLVLLKVEGPLG